MSVTLSPWARDKMTLVEVAEVQAYGKAHKVNVDITWTRSGRCFTATVGESKGHDRARPIEAFHKALDLADIQIVRMLGG